jgi:hypothetical protein
MGIEKIICNTIQGVTQNLIPRESIETWYEKARWLKELIPDFKYSDAEGRRKFCRDAGIFALLMKANPVLAINNLDTSKNYCEATPALGDYEIFLRYKNPDTNKEFKGTLNFTKFENKKFRMDVSKDYVGKFYREASSRTDTPIITNLCRSISLLPAWTDKKEVLFQEDLISKKLYEVFYPNGDINSISFNEAKHITGTLTQVCMQHGVHFRLPTEGEMTGLIREVYNPKTTSELKEFVDLRDIEYYNSNNKTIKNILGTWQLTETDYRNSKIKHEYDEYNAFIDCFIKKGGSWGTDNITEYLPYFISYASRKIREPNTSVRMVLDIDKSKLIHE